MQIKHNLSSACGFYLPKALLPKSQGSLRSEMLAFLSSPSTFPHDSTFTWSSPVCLPIQIWNLVFWPSSSLLPPLKAVPIHSGTAPNMPRPQHKAFLLLLKFPDHPSLTLESCWWQKSLWIWTMIFRYLVILLDVFSTFLKSFQNEMVNRDWFGPQFTNFGM